MTQKNIPFSKKQLDQIIKNFPTPFHIYDERGIKENAGRLNAVFSWADGFKEYFAVKAAPNPYLMKLFQRKDMGADCSSLPELLLAERCGITGETIMFTSNDTPADEFVKARELGAIINLDDLSHIAFLERHAGLPPLQSACDTIPALAQRQRHHRQPAGGEIRFYPGAAFRRLSACLKRRACGGSACMP